MARNEALFEESSQGAVSAVTGVMVVLSMALLFGGLLLLSYAFDVALEPTTQATIFTGGLLAAVLGMFLPFSLLGTTGK